MPYGQSKTFGFSNEIIPFLIVGGTGNGIGVFVYNGTPGFGNPPIAWLTNGSLVDPFGNPLPAVMGIAGVGEFSAGVATITSTGLFLYTTGGQLAFSFSTVNGNDPRNNQAYQAGLWVYNTSGGGGVALIQGVSPTIFLFPPSSAHMEASPQLEGGVENPGASNEYVVGVFDSGVENGPGGNTAVQVYSETFDGTSGARGALVITGLAVLNWNANGVTVTNHADGNTYNVGTLSSYVPATVPISNAGGVTVLSVSVAAATYRIHAIIECLQGSVAQAQQIGLIGPATAAPTRLFYDFVEQGTAQAFSNITNTSTLTQYATPAYNATSTFFLHIDGTVTFSASGTLSISGIPFSVADDFSVINGSFIDITKAS